MAAPNRGVSEPDRIFWLAVRRALLAIVKAIEVRFLDE
jgi:hypothetical protein